MNSRFVLFSLIVSMVPFGLIALGARTPAAEPAPVQDAPLRSYQFDKTMSRDAGPVRVLLGGGHAPAAFFPSESYLPDTSPTTRPIG
jgi:hypothetical protein